MVSCYVFTAHKFDYPIEERKPNVPAKDEKPIMGLKTDKNFISANAIENILAAAKKTSSEPLLFTKKPEYGKVPEYLTKIKKEINEEYEYVKAVHEKQQQKTGTPMRLLTEEERDELLQALRTKWNELNKKYQSHSFAIPAAKKNQTEYASLDRIKVVKKETMEAELDALEKEIQKLSKKHIFVVDEQQVVQQGFAV